MQRLSYLNVPVLATTSDQTAADRCKRGSGMDCFAVCFCELLPPAHASHFPAGWAALSARRSRRSSRLACSETQVMLRVLVRARIFGDLASGKSQIARSWQPEQIEQVATESLSMSWLHVVHAQGQIVVESQGSCTPA